MLSCILGALLCSASPHYIDGPLAYARPATPSAAWGYAAYSVVPTRQAFPTTFPVTALRRS